MAKVLDFNKFEQPTLPIVMRDENKTPFTVVAPSLELIEELEANQDDIVAACKSGNRESLNTAWALAAKLISCNQEGRQVTAEDLQQKYRMTYTMLFAFIVAFREMVHEIENAKN